ncbi:MAG: hypothetical protein GOU99_01090 [Candidatus Altiarchaeota archaeon]|nr:hypothetical protein [Candidatus Altiarchaeota archaeon]
MEIETREYSHEFPTKGTAKILAVMMPKAIVVGKKVSNTQICEITMINSSHFPEFFDIDKYDSFETRKITDKTAISEYRKQDKPLGKLLVSPVIKTRDYGVERTDYFTFSKPIGYHDNYSVWFSEVQEYRGTYKKIKQRKLAFFERESGKKHYVPIESDLKKSVKTLSLISNNLEVFMDDGLIEQYRILTASGAPSVTKSNFDIVQKNLE